MERSGRPRSRRIQSAKNQPRSLPLVFSRSFSKATAWTVGSLEVRGLVLAQFGKGLLEGFVAGDAAEHPPDGSGFAAVVELVGGGDERFAGGGGGGVGLPAAVSKPTSAMLRGCMRLLSARMAAGRP